MSELIRQFGIDWKLLLAQVVNFLVLMYLLKRFAYGPILSMLRERRKKIEEGMHASDEAKRKLREAEATQKAIILKAEEESVAVVSRAEGLAQQESKNILDQAYVKSQEVLAASQKRAEEDRLKLESEVEQSAKELIKKGLAATIGRMKPTERDEVLISEALKHLKSASAIK